MASGLFLSDGCGIEVEAVTMAGTRADRRRVHVQWNAAHVRLIDPPGYRCMSTRQQRAPPHSRPGSSHTNPAEHRTAATTPRRNCRTAHWCVVPGHASKPGRRSGALHPRRAEPDEEVRRCFHRGGLRPGTGNPRESLSLRVRYLEHNPQLPLSLRRSRSADLVSYVYQ